MKKCLTFALLTIFFAFSTTHAQSFRLGNTFHATNISGYLSVQCNDPQLGNRFQNYNCSDVRLAPAEYDYFNGPKNDADTVDLQATHEDGSQSWVASVGYKDGQSTDQVNLWISTLLQHPLFDSGVNKVNYTFKKDSKIIGSGEFDVLVDQGKDQQCPDGFSSSSSSMECNDSYMACEEYFQQYNYCF